MRRCKKDAKVLKMDLTHIKYAVEVEKTKSITRAAENLFMSQPNLSRSIRELEESLGIRIFKRTSKGVIPTEQGEEFLAHARNILAQIEKIESIRKKSLHSRLLFSISAPEAVYIAQAAASMISGLPSSKKICFSYIVTDNLSAMDNVSQNGHNLGIIRFNAMQEKYFTRLLKEKGLIAEQILEFQHIVLMSRNHPLASKESITHKDLSDYIEISGSDPYAGPLLVQEAKCMLSVKEGRQIPDAGSDRKFVTEGNDSQILSEGNGSQILTTGNVSQLYLLSTVTTAYMWSPPVPERALEQFSLVRCSCSDLSLRYIDYLIYRKNYKFNELDKKFIDELQNITRPECLQPL